MERSWLSSPDSSRRRRRRADVGRLVQWEQQQGELQGNLWMAGNQRGEIVERLRHTGKQYRDLVPTGSFVGTGMSQTARYTTQKHRPSALVLSIATLDDLMLSG